MGTVVNQTRYSTKGGSLKIERTVPKNIQGFLLKSI